jgi:hypothetical protein
MDSEDVVDDANALLKLGVGDSYRLEHIKQAYVQNKTIWVTDENYLKRMKEKYLTKHNPDTQSSADVIFENESEDKETIHCWKCGKKGPLGANFCMICGTSIFEVGANPKPIPEVKSKSFTKSIPLKIPILVGIPLLIVIILGAGYTMGSFDDILEKQPVTDSMSVDESEEKELLPSEINSKCGAGTKFDPVSDSCILR